jgi:regulator of sigma E protease
MFIDLLHTLLSSVWSIFLVVFFFGGSIFVHELGHFLVARRRGVHVERFSIGFGRAIFKWRGKDGVEYRLSWIPLGGYVLLPQLADLGPIEGRSETDVESLPPISYTSKMLVFVAGAAFNILFAFALAIIIWFIGQPANSDTVSTSVGRVSPTLTLANGQVVPSAAVEAGLQVGDVIRSIDGTPVEDWSDIEALIKLGSGQSADGRRQSVFAIERDGQTLTLAVHPRLSGDGFRQVGIAPGYDLIVQEVPPAPARPRRVSSPATRFSASTAWPRSMSERISNNWMTRAIAPSPPA